MGTDHGLSPSSLAHIAEGKEGPDDIDVEQNNEMLGLLGPHVASLLLRVWYGCQMKGPAEPNESNTVSCLSVWSTSSRYPSPPIQL